VGHLVCAASVAARVAAVLVGLQLFTCDAEVFPKGASLVLTARVCTLRGGRWRWRWVWRRAEDLTLSQPRGNVGPRLVLGCGRDAGEVVEVLDIDRRGYIEDLLESSGEGAFVEDVFINE